MKVCPRDPAHGPMSRRPFKDGKTRGWRCAHCERARAKRYKPENAGTRLDPALREEVVRLYVEDGLSAREIEEETGVGRATAARIVRAAGHQMRAPRPPRAAEYTDEQKRKAVSQYMRGDSLAGAGRFVGACEQTVRKWVVEAGLEIRSPGPKRGGSKLKPETIEKREAQTATTRCGRCGEWAFTGTVVQGREEFKRHAAECPAALAEAA
jgi:transposase-like protein